MAIAVIGTSGALLEVENSTKALRNTMRPNEALGYYRASVATGLTAGLAADAPVFSFRWGAASPLCVIRKILIVGRVIVNFTASQEVSADVVVARSFTVSDSAGTVAAAVKLRSSQPSSQLTDMRAAAAVALTAGVRTLDATPIAYAVDANKLGASVTTMNFVGAYDASAYGTHPLVLAQNEGFVVRNKILQGAGGSVRFLITVDWEEMTSY